MCSMHASSFTAAAKICPAHQIRLELVKTMSLSVMHSVDIIPSRDTVFGLHYLSQKTQYTSRDGIMKWMVFSIKTLCSHDPLVPYYICLIEVQLTIEDHSKSVVLK